REQPCRARHPRGGVRRRLAPQGRSRLGRGAAAEGDQRAGRALARARARAAANRRAVRRSDGPGARLRACRARAARAPVRPPARRSARDPFRWARIASGRRGDGVRVFYGRDRMPGRDEPAYGGLVKLARLADVLPNDSRGFSVLYLGSSSRPHDSRMLIRLARRRRAAFVWNQDGVAYPGWAGAATDRLNRPLAHGLHAADHVLYQSDFCKLSADRFLGEPAGAWEV